MPKLNHAEWSHVHSVFGPLITKVAREVSMSFTRKRGYVQTYQEDIEQEVYIRLARHGMTVDALNDLDSTEAWLRSTARFAAHDIAERLVGGYRDDGRPRVEVADLTLDPEDGWAWVGNSIDYASQSPEADFLQDLEEVDALALDAEVKETVFDIAETILLNIPSLVQRETMRLVYLEGMTAVEAAERLGTTKDSAQMAVKRGRKVIGDSAEASLRALRDAYHPKARGVTGEAKGTPDAILDRLG